MKANFNEASKDISKASSLDIIQQFCFNGCSKKSKCFSTILQYSLQISKSSNKLKSKYDAQNHCYSFFLWNFFTAYHKFKLYKCHIFTGFRLFTHLKPLSVSFHNCHFYKGIWVLMNLHTHVWVWICYHRFVSSFTKHRAHCPSCNGGSSNLNKQHFWGIYMMSPPRRTEPYPQLALWGCHCLFTHKTIGPS